jgi:hypothetical protein
MVIFHCYVSSVGHQRVSVDSVGPGCPGHQAIQTPRDSQKHRCHALSCAEVVSIAFLAPEDRSSLAAPRRVKVPPGKLT